MTMQRKILLGLAALAVVLGIGGGLYWLNEQRYVFTDKAQVAAPAIPLGPQSPGVLRSVMVEEGQELQPGQEVAIVGNEGIESRVAGIAMTVNKNIGSAYQPGQPVVTMFQPSELRIVARIEEDKGLKDVHVGQQAIFTVDAYGGQQFMGTVENVSQTSRSGDVVFNISDQREEQEYEVKIAYDRAGMPPFLNGMSARVWIVK